MRNLIISSWAFFLVAAFPVLIDSLPGVVPDVEKNSHLAYADDHMHAYYTARWCVINDPELGKCQELKVAFSQSNLKPRLECVVGVDAADCLNLIKSFKADLITLDTGDVYVAGKDFSMVVLLAEVYGTDKGVKKPKYNAVAVVKANDKSINSLADLKGKKSCHTGVGRSAGWNIPIGILLGSGVMSVEECNNPVYSATKFFNASCAPGAQDPTFSIGGYNVDSACSLCAGTEKDYCSRSTDPFSSYDGAFKCLRDGKGDVAFVKDVTPLQMTKGQTQPGSRDSDFELLCPDGRRASIYQSSECFLGSSPAHAVMTLSAQSEAAKGAFKNLLLQAQKVVGDKMFGKSKERYGRGDLMFKDSTLELLDVGDRSNYKSYLGSYVQVVEGMTKCDVEQAVFCVTSDKEIVKLSQLAREFNMKRWRPKIIPLKRSTHDECIKAVANGEADIVILDGGDAATAGAKYGLVPIIYENYGSNDASYYGVAVVHKSDKQIKLKNLKGAKSCHTGIGKTAGWNVPVGYLIGSNQISQSDLKNQGCNVAAAVANFFSKSCAPGSNSPEFNKNTISPNPKNLCALCKGKGQDFCARNPAEPYYDYSGSFRCLVENGAGTVGFMKHTTVPDNTDGANQQSWAQGLMSQDFELLCTDGSRKEVHQWKDCHLMRVPAEVMMTSGKKTPKERKILIDLFLRAQETFGDKAKADPHTFSMFRSGPNDNNILFKDDTVKLEAVPADSQNYKSYLGQDYINMLQDLNCGKVMDQSSNMIDAPSTPSSVSRFTTSAASLAYPHSTAHVAFSSIILTLIYMTLKSLLNF